MGLSRSGPPARDATVHTIPLATPALESIFPQTRLVALHPAHDTWLDSPCGQAAIKLDACFNARRARRPNPSYNQAGEQPSGAGIFTSGSQTAFCPARLFTRFKYRPAIKLALYLLRTKALAAAPMRAWRVGLLAKSLMESAAAR